jgi:hypothetical protein
LALGRGNNASDTVLALLLADIAVCGADELSSFLFRWRFFLRFLSAAAARGHATLLRP